MSIWRINGGRQLCGSVRSQGAKNAALPIIAASVICPCETELLNCPRLRDIETALDILRHLGCGVEREDDIVNIDSRELCRYDIPECLMREMRASVLFLGALAARTGRAEISAPGGCRIGKRPIDIHLSMLSKLGYDVSDDGSRIVCSAGELTGGEFELPYPSVGATENAMLAACAAKGRTVIHNAAREPEISALGAFLICMGADVSGLGTGSISINGCRPSDRVGFRIPADRIVTATQLCAVAACGGSAEISGAIASENEAVLDGLKRCGCEITGGGQKLSIRAPERLCSAGLIATRPFPGFPTDAQPLMMAASLRSAGSTIFIENIFENRYMHAHEFRKLGASVQTEGRVALVTGIPQLHGSEMRASDLRGGAGLVIAAMSAQGQSLVVDDGEYIARGYEDISALFSGLGADIEPWNMKG